MEILVFQINKSDYINQLSKIDLFLKETSLNIYYESSGLEFILPDYSRSEITDFFFYQNSGSYYNIEKSLVEQYSYEECDYQYFSELDILEVILLIFSKSKFNEENKERFLQELISELIGLGIIIKRLDTGGLEILNNKLLDSGSYCNIYYYSNNILLKEIKSEYRGTPFEKRLKYEFENMKKLEDSENILNVYNYLEEDEAYTMEQADECLYDYLRKNHLNLEEKIKIVRDILKGIKDAHDNSVIHRDLHLGNILRKGSTFMIADFGLAKDLDRDRSLKSSNTQKSNSKFVDPECRGNKFLELDKVSDIYSLGVIIEEILGEDVEKVSYFISRCTQRLKKDRYQSMDEVIYEFENTIINIDKQLSKEKVKEKIKNGRVDQSVIEYLKTLTAEETVHLILEYSDNFEEILKLCEIHIAYKMISDILESLERYIRLPFTDYSCIAKMMHRLFYRISDEKIKIKIKEIIRFCAEEIGRYDCEPLYQEIKNK